MLFAFRCVVAAAAAASGCFTDRIEKWHWIPSRHPETTTIDPSIPPETAVGRAIADRANSRVHPRNSCCCWMMMMMKMMVAVVIDLDSGMVRIVAVAVAPRPVSWHRAWGLCSSNRSSSRCCRRWWGTRNSEFGNR